ncbi:lipopolysaccharide biosynthesis protein [Methyloversatilis thermotolerans]|uniref:lipopolysaccharide biosynthesis protein n=1 Tax=Methyloversatilis thermotolerans TaxID=1346290 RepID=UPI0003672973|nr:lipopolysaccharide biosynthesis protein [Methyloversatilis thermotolerans]
MKINKTFLWAIALRTSPALINFFFFLILAKLMGPAEFGVLALAQVWLGGFRILGNSGFSGAVIQARNLTDRQLSSVFFLNLGISLLLVLLCSASVWIFPTDPSVGDFPQVVSLMSLTLMISGVALVQEALAYRGMRLRFLAQRDLISALVGGAVGIALALHGWGVWALVMQALVSSLVGVILLWHGANWLPKWREFSLADVKPLLKFSLWMLAFQLFAYLARESDKTMIGFMVGITALGIYTLANKFILLPSMIFADALNSYLFPKLSSLQTNPDDMSRVYAGSVYLTMSIVPPSIFALGIVIYLYGVPAFGPQWEGVDKAVPYVAIIAACQSYISPAGSVLKALGRVSLLFKWAVFVFCLMVIGVLGGVAFGIEGIMAGLVCANLICTIAVSLLLHQLIGKTSMMKQVVHFYAIIGFGLGLAAVTINSIASLGVQNFAISAVVTFASALFYFSTVFLVLRKRIGHYLKLN